MTLLLNNTTLIIRKDVELVCWHYAAADVHTCRWSRDSDGFLIAHSGCPLSFSCRPLPLSLYTSSSTHLATSPPSTILPNLLVQRSWCDTLYIPFEFHRCLLIFVTMVTALDYPLSKTNTCLGHPGVGDTTELFRLAKLCLPRERSH